MRRAIATTVVLLGIAGFLFVTLASKSVNTGATYKIELNNAFGLVTGSDFKVAGATVGKITNMDLCTTEHDNQCQNPLDSLITVSVNENGFGAFHHDAFCQSRPQSLIGEYFLDCSPGTQGPTLKSGSTIPVSNTQSTIPADLVQNIMRLPYSQRFSIIINELGAAVAARSTDLAVALRRADPALAETDNLLALLSGDAHTIRDLNVSANNVIKALAQNDTQVQRFIVEANNTATASASSAANHNCAGSTQANCIAATWNLLPGFLQQLRPAMQKLGQAADAQDAVFSNLNDAASNLNTFFHQLVPFSQQSAISLGCGESGVSSCPPGGASLGTAASVGTPAVKAALPTVKSLREFTGETGCLSQNMSISRAGRTTGFSENCLPELSQNLAITLQAMDASKPINYGNGQVGGGPVEADPRSPGGTGYTGLQGLMMYAFNITNAINTFSTYGHELAVDGFVSSECSPYASPQSIANNIAQYTATGGNLNSYNPQNPRTCYASLGPNQPGVTTTDPSDPSACVPDPGGYPVEGYGTHYTGPKTSACKLSASTAADKPNAKTSGARSGASSTSASGGGGGGSSGSGAQNGVSNAVSQIVSQLSGATGTASSPASSATNAASSATQTQTSQGGNSSSSSQTQQLLNYLLSP
jgi:phospholipid/cholesterol/gamma-HCH transport system substrate-binding protein